MCAIVRVGRIDHTEAVFRDSVLHHRSAHGGSLMRRSIRRMSTHRASGVEGRKPWATNGRPLGLSLDF
jgi:hypothetical protein